MPPRRLSRRHLLRGLGATVGAAALGCGKSKQGIGSVADAAGINDAAPPTDAPLPDAVPLSAEELLGQIDTIVVLCMENRSFDHYLGSLKLSENWDIDGLTGSESNLDPLGNPVPVYRLNDFEPADPPHSWDECHRQWNGGLNDGFVTEHAGPSQNQVMGYHERDQLPSLYALADGGAVCDRWYCSVLGPTWPNRFYLHGATSNGIKSNLPVFGFEPIWPSLEAAGVSHVNYHHGVAWATGGYAKLTGLASIDQFFADAQSGGLPNFSIIDPSFFGGGANDDHPSHNIMLGQALINSVFAALAQSPQWDRCLFVVTYDEHGGFYDHVRPLTVSDASADFGNQGFRVPSIVAGPYTKRGQAVSTILDHASVISTLTTRYGLTPLNQRVQTTNDLSSCIDANTLGNPQPAPVLPSVPVSLSEMKSWPVNNDDHIEMRQFFDKAKLPLHLDARHESLEITERVLRHGERLGAVRVVR